MKLLIQRQGCLINLSYPVPVMSNMKLDVYREEEQRHLGAIKRGKQLELYIQSRNTCGRKELESYR